MDTFGQRLRAERERLGYTQPQWGAIVGVEKNAQGNYEADKRSPDSNYLMAAAKAGADIVYILTGERSEASLPSTVDDVMRRIERQALDDVVEASRAETVTVPLYEAHLMAGKGHQNGDAPQIAALGFPRSWLKSLGVSPAGAVLAFARGDSMRPTIQAGDILLIDRHAAGRLPPPRSQGDQRPAPIFALQDDGGARVKRLVTVAPDSVLLLSDNPDVAPELRRAADLTFIGRVVWWGHAAA